MIIYAPHRGLLIEAMREAQEFEDFDAMKRYIVENTNRDGRDILSIEDIVIGQVDPTGDKRCGWKNIMNVCTKRYGEENYIEKYGTAQCIGTCSTEYSPYDRKHWANLKIYG